MNQAAQLRRAGYTVLCVGLALLLAGCSQPAPESPPMELPESYIVADDFSPPNVAWARFDEEQSAVYGLAGELYVEDRGKESAVYTPLVNYEYTDVTVSVRIRHVQGAVDNWMGVICRQQDEDNYYLLAISADGYYLVLKVEEGFSTPLAGPEYSETINVGKDENQLQVRCNDRELTLWANGEQLVRRVDTTFTRAGTVALFVDAISPGVSTTAAFDNFILTSP